MAERQNVGRWSDRLKSGRDNPREVAFADQWEDENLRGHTTTHILGEMLYGHGHGSASVCGPHCNVSVLPVALDLRDSAVAATVIQWLGSNVGMDFLEQALQRCGYRIEKVSI